MKKYGLALGGGGTKGAYHIGVFNALEKLNISISHVTGTSIGSVNGALFAQGDIKIAEQIWNNIEMSDIIEVSKLKDVGKNLFETKNFLSVISLIYKENGIDTTPFKELLNSVIDEDKIRSSDVKFGLVTFSLDDKEKIELSIDDIPDGKLIDYIMASTALPGLKQAVIDDKKYIDGGVIDNLPYNMLIKNGITDIISVNVGGLGMVKEIENTGINYINIKCSENIIGHLDFNEENISKMIKMGYMDTLKAFGRVEGKIYSFNISDYHKTRGNYSEDIIYGIEKAAQIFGIDKLKIYRFDDLKEAVIRETLKNINDSSDTALKTPSIDGLKLNEKQLFLKFVSHISKNETDAFSNKIFQGLLGDLFVAANSVIYFMNEK